MKRPNNASAANDASAGQAMMGVFDMPLSRRAVLKGGLYGAGGCLLSDWLARSPLQAAPAPNTSGKAKSVIQIWMWGGPCHLDTFDPKPEAGQDYTGPFTGAIETNVSGMRIHQLLPKLAQQADKYSLIRSMTHGVFAHETASYIVQTGRKPGGRDVFPCVGAVVSLFKGYNAGYKGLIPPYVVLTEPQGRFSEAGFLGGTYKPFATGGNPGAPQFLVEGVASPGVTEEQQHQRRELLHRLDMLNAAMPGHPQLQALNECENQAYELIVGDAGKVFDPNQEPEEVRQRYGRNTFGQSCLVARRLVEAGVPYITINYKGWDTHKEHFQIMRRKLPELDAGLSSLLQDLADRGLLESTIVWCGGEFGRKPQVSWEAPWNGGRQHYGHVFSTLVAGGGFRGGQVLGSSDAKGEFVKDRPVYQWDFISTMYQQLGIDPQAPLPHPQGKTVLATPTVDDGYEIGGRLNEIT
ncbi:DUF1501 domain-containing protein [Aeoliella mucimassa]|uniref:DUF1501 domain-containing protein n=1 Tax=Aeoliella mucimassa TaxID=2527972 RepID=A0A518AVR0_9BACT|nr:DUF1501 domain-containing protein [Aeoliella mucimassa]QDU58815.1 hypothetical protein Pan181_50550 [Aeoliella mucimassa]